MGTSYRNSYLTDELKNFQELPDAKHPLPLNYIVHLEETFTDSENVNFIFEYLPGENLYWVL